MNTRLAERIAESDRLAEGQAAEGYGLRAAPNFATPPPYSSDPYIQARFELGFKEGHAILEIDP